MNVTNGTYEIVTPTRAIVEFTWSNGISGAQTVEVTCAADLHDACYAVASIRASLRGEMLGGFRPRTG